MYSIFHSLWIPKKVKKIVNNQQFFNSILRLFEWHNIENIGIIAIKLKFYLIFWKKNKKKLRVETSPLFNIDRAITYRWYRRCALHGTVQVFQLYKKGSVTADKCELAQRLIMPKAWRCYRNGMPEKLVCVKTHVTCI